MELRMKRSWRRGEGTVEANTREWNEAREEVFREDKIRGLAGGSENASAWGWCPRCVGGWVR